MSHTNLRVSVRRICQTLFCGFLLCAAVLGEAQSSTTETMQRKARAATAAVLLLEVADGRSLLQSGDLERKSAPGSVLKPLVLIAALQSGAIDEHATVACRGTLNIRGHNLACSHPRDITILDARQALAASCNTYFASVAERMSGPALVTGLQKFGLTPAREPKNGDERALLALGLQDLSVNAKQLGEAYVRLARSMNAQPGGAASTVRYGLLQSVVTGMANAAQVKNVTLGGKTGTVDDAGGRSHGWFAGIVFADSSGLTAQKVIVVFEPNGNGADAARLASTMLSEALEQR